MFNLQAHVCRIKAKPEPERLEFVRLALGDNDAEYDRIGYPKSIGFDKFVSRMGTERLLIGFLSEDQRMDVVREQMVKARMQASVPWLYVYRASSLISLAPESEERTERTLSLLRGWDREAENRPDLAVQTSPELIVLLPEEQRKLEIKQALLRCIRFEDSGGHSDLPLSKIYKCLLNLLPGTGQSSKDDCVAGIFGELHQEGQIDDWSYLKCQTLALSTLSETTRSPKVREAIAFCKHVAGDCADKTYKKRISHNSGLIALLPDAERLPFVQDELQIEEKYSAGRDPRFSPLRRVHLIMLLRDGALAVVAENELQFIEGMGLTEKERTGYGAQLIPFVSAEKREKLISQQHIDFIKSDLCGRSPTFVFESIAGRLIKAAPDLRVWAASGIFVCPRTPESNDIMAVVTFGKPDCAPLVVCPDLGEVADVIEQAEWGQHRLSRHHRNFLAHFAP